MMMLPGEEMHGLGPADPGDDAHAFAEAALEGMRGVRFIGRRIIVPRGERGARPGGLGATESAVAVLARRLASLEKQVEALREHLAESRKRAATMDAAGASAPD